MANTFTKTTIEILPNEIFEIIFKELNLKDLVTCVRTCIRWNQIISHKFKGQILIATGDPAKNGQEIEIIDLVNPDFKCQHFQKVQIPPRWGCVGGFVNGCPLICGGFDGSYLKDCIFIGQSNQPIKMLEERRGASGIVLGQSVLWIVGGRDGRFSGLSSSEFIQIGQPPIKGPDLPFPIRWHSMIHFDKNCIYIIGGFQNDSVSRKTWIVTLNNFNVSENGGKFEFEIKEGPSLNIDRKEHSSGKMQINGKTYLIAAGGINEANSYLDSVEILDPLDGKGWKLGPKLPFQISDASMVTSPNGRGVVLIGGIIYKDNFGTPSDLLIELSGNSRTSLEWKYLEQRLQYPRAFHVAVPMPTDITN